MSGVASKMAVGKEKKEEEEIFVLRITSPNLSEPIVLNHTNVRRIKFDTNRLPRLQGVELVARAHAYKKCKGAEPDQFVREAFTYRNNNPKSGEVLLQRSNCVGASAMMWHGNCVAWKQPESVEVTKQKGGKLKMPKVAEFGEDGGKWVYACYDESHVVLVTEKHECVYLSREQLRAESEKAKKARQLNTCTEEVVEVDDSPTPSPPAKNSANKGRGKGKKRLQELETVMEDKEEEDDDDDVDDAEFSDDEAEEVPTPSPPGPKVSKAAKIGGKRRREAEKEADEEVEFIPAPLKTAKPSKPTDKKENEASPMEDMEEVPPLKSTKALKAPMKKSE